MTDPNFDDASRDDDLPDDGDPTGAADGSVNGKTDNAVDRSMDRAADGATSNSIDDSAGDTMGGSIDGVADGAMDGSADGPTGDARGLWDGDTGTLAFDTRRVLVQLLAGPSLDVERHRLLWPVLIRDEAALRSRLADLFLELLVDADLGVAFVRQVETDELDIPVLLRRQQLTFVDSVVLLHLRQLLIRAQSAGERAVVSTGELVDAASVYARSDSTDHAGFARRVAASVEKLKKASLLRKLRGSDERFEVAPTLKLLFSAERVEALLREYRQLGGAPSSDTVPNSGERDTVVDAQPMSIANTAPDTNVITPESDAP